MKQYCRYCANCVYGDVAYCEAKGMCLSDAYAKRPNKCREFEFNEIDAFGENKHPYRTREKKPAVGEQITIFDRLRR